ncbi:MAG TPA: FAD-dependent oxidoreductase [Anaerolineaceae bacterium]|nr:FAD-dependent oxidoreductase [Anaerolineaceae bacterium]
MPKVVVIGGGWAGCSAALAAKQIGAEVEVLERTDCLLGTGLVGGIFRNNGRFTAAEEMIAMGAGDLFDLMDKVSRHKNINFPGHQHASLYDVALMEPTVKRYMFNKGIVLKMQHRATDVRVENGVIKAIEIENHDAIEGDVFIETTGTAGPQVNCTKFGNGCAMCVLRCPSFGGRVSIAGKAGIPEKMGRKPDGTFGAMSGSCKLHFDSVSPEIAAKLRETGVAVVPIPKELVHTEKLATKACQQYALPEYAENVVLLDTGHVKLMTPFFPLEELRQIPGMENSRYEDPYSGGRGNSIRYLALSPRTDELQVIGVDNLFCAGEKAGLLVGHTEAIVTGVLAGNNAVRSALGKSLVKIPLTISIGDAITFVREQMETEEGMSQKYTFSGSTYFKRMQALNLYTTDIQAIKERVESAGMTNFFALPIS